MILGLDPTQLLMAVAVTLFAGFVKGAVGFAMPMIMMSVFTSFLPPTTALALVIVPTLVTNVAQALRQGVGPARQTAWRFRWHIGMVVLFIAVSAGFASRIPKGWMALSLGAPIMAFALWQLAGRPMALPVHHRRPLEIGTGIIGGLYGGISGIWGPPLIVLLLSLGVPKDEQMRAQGVVFLIGSVMLAAAHLVSGLLWGPLLGASCLMVLPASAGVAIGARVQDRLDPAQFRRWTLLLLALTGANLVRQALSSGL